MASFFASDNPLKAIHKYLSNNEFDVKISRNFYFRKVFMYPKVVLLNISLIFKFKKNSNKRAESGFRSAFLLLPKLTERQRT